MRKSRHNIFLFRYNIILLSYFSLCHYARRAGTVKIIFIIFLAVVFGFCLVPVGGSVFRFSVHFYYVVLGNRTQENIELVESARQVKPVPARQGEPVTQECT
jgi:hypothetical protein